jgi:PAS domain S-box-containing protein
LSERQSSFEEVLSALSDDPGFREFLRPDSALLLWDLEGSRLLWASSPAAGLRETLSEDAEGHVSAAFQARGQLRALGQGLAPAQGARLERIHFEASRLTPPVTCACRRIVLPSGEGALLTAIIGPLPRFARLASARRGIDQTASVGVPDQALAAPKDGGRREPPEGKRRQAGPVRFLWHTDASGRFTYCSDALAEVVGQQSAAIVGRTWDEIAGELVLDPEDEVSDLFARAKTWTGRTVMWRVVGTDRAIAVDLAGAPVFDRGRAFQGFRGFGLCRTDAVTEWSRERGRPAAMPPKTTPTVRLHAPRSQSKVAEEAAPTHAPGLLDKEAAPTPREAHPPEHRAFPHLSDAERVAFREIARALGARFDDSPVPTDPAQPRAEIIPVFPREAAHPQTIAILDSLPVGVLVCRGDTPLFANRFLLDVSGYETVGALSEDGGVARLFPGRSPGLARPDEAAPLTLSTRRRESVPVDVRLATLHWEGVPATAVVVRTLAEHDPGSRVRALELNLRASDARVRELSAILDMAGDGIVLLDGSGRILSMNRSAEALFGYNQREVAGESFTVLLAPESREVALDYLDALQGSGMTRFLNDGREMVGRVRQGSTIPFYITIGRISEEPERKYCMMLRDITILKKAEAELLAAKRAAEEANAGRSDLLAKVSHEVRTPLNAIIGFAEVMLEERFGRLGNERYRDYLKDIHESGRRVLGLVSGLLDLAKIEAGRMELSFTTVFPNEVVGACVSSLLQQASRERIVVRTSFAPKLPPVVADERSLSQIVTNVVSNAVKFTHAGGQVIISTAVTERGEVVIRVRDTGIGMTEQEIEAALEPLRQLATTRKGSGAGLGLPLTKALVEANRAMLHISSAPHEGTLVEIVFPPTRVLAE